MDSTMKDHGISHESDLRLQVFSPESRCRPCLVLEDRLHVGYVPFTNLIDRYLHIILGFNCTIRFSSFQILPSILIFLLCYNTPSLIQWTFIHLETTPFVKKTS